MEGLINWLRQFWQQITNKIASALAVNKASAGVTEPGKEKPAADATQLDKPEVKAGAKKVAKPKAKKASTKGLASQVTADHVKQACEQIDHDGVPKARASRISSVVVGGNHYPPKYVLALAVAAATGSPQPLKNVDADGVLKSLGFDVIAK